MKILERLKKEKTACDSTLVLLGNISSQLAGLVVTVIISRTLSIAQYGIYSVLNSISSFVTDLADMGMNGAITRFVAEFNAENNKESEEKLIGYALKRKIINFFIAFLIIQVCAKPIAYFWLHNTQLYYYVHLIIITCGFSLLIGALRAVLQGRQEFKKYFISIITWNVIWCVSIIIMKQAGIISVLSSILAGAISGLITLCVCIYLTKPNLKLGRSFMAPSIVKNDFNKFGFWMALWSICAILQSKMDVFLLASLTTPEEVSFYDIANKLTKPILMVASSYAQVLNPQFASIKSETGISNRVRNLTKFISVITILIVICMVAIQPIVFIIFGHKYDNAITPTRLLLFAIIFFVWTIPYNSALYALNKPYVYTIAALSGLIVTVIGDLLLLPTYGAIGAAITYIFAQIIGLVVALFAYKKNIKRD